MIAILASLWGGGVEWEGGGVSDVVETHRLPADHPSRKGCAVCIRHSGPTGRSNRSIEDIVRLAE